MTEIETRARKLKPQEYQGGTSSVTALTGSTEEEQFTVVSSH